MPSLCTKKLKCPLFAQKLGDNLKVDSTYLTLLAKYH